MGSTLEAQKKKAPTPKKQEIVVSPGKPYHSSSSLRDGLDQSLPVETMAAQLTGSGIGKSGVGAMAYKALAGVQNLFRNPEGQRGARYAEKIAKETERRNQKDLMRSDGGVARKIRVF
tara:strand:+ start:70 stop:423 length:354 start_codon:yes stop_codon:yes gene_type:complete